MKNVEELETSCDANIVLRVTPEFKKRVRAVAEHKKTDMTKLVLAFAKPKIEKLYKELVKENKNTETEVSE